MSYQNKIEKLTKNIKEQNRKNKAKVDELSKKIKYGKNGKDESSILDPVVLGVSKSVEKLIEQLNADKFSKLLKEFDVVRKEAEREPTSKEIVEILKKNGINLSQLKGLSVDELSKKGHGHPHKHKEFKNYLSKEEYLDRQNIFAKEAMRVINNIEKQAKKVNEVEEHLIALVGEKEILEKAFGVNIKGLKKDIDKLKKKKTTKYATTKWVLEIARNLQARMGGGNVTVSEQGPKHPNLNQLWLDISTTTLFYWNGTSWVTVAGEGDGDVVGPGAVADNSVARFDGLTGILIDDSAVYILDNGNVGIGTASPEAIFHVRKTGSGTGINTSVALYDADGFSQVIIKSDRTTTGQNIGSFVFMDGNDAKKGNCLGSVDGDFLFRNDTTNLMKIQYDGYVGIGTIAPAQKLDVSGAIALNGTQIAYRPTDYTGTLILGDGGGSLDTGADYNTFVGIGAGFSNTTGERNTANGYQSLYLNTTGEKNTANGQVSLFSNTTGGNNTANGYASLRYNTTGGNNTANGYYSLLSSGKTLTAGSFIIGVPYTIKTAGDTDFTAIGSANNTVGTIFTATGVGTGTGTASANANNNLGLGYQAGRYFTGSADLTAPSNSTFLGYNTMALADGGDNETVIGYSAVGIGDNSVVLGNDSVVTTVLKGNVGIGTTSPGAKLDIQGTISISDDDIDQYLKYSDATVVATEVIDTDYSTVYGNYNVITLPDSDSYDHTKLSLYASRDNAVYKGTGSLRSLYGSVPHATVDESATGDIDYVSALWGNSSNQGSGTVTDNYGLKLFSQNFKDGVSGTTTNTYGANVIAQSVGFNAGGVSTATNVYGSFISAQSVGYITGTSNVTDLYGSYIEAGAYIVSAGTATATNVYSIYLNNGYSDNSGDVTNAYGLYIEDITHGDTLNYNIYSAGSTGINYFGGNVGIGTTAPGYKLEVIGNSPQLVLSSSKTDNTLKSSIVGSVHYNISEEPITSFYTVGGETSNRLDIGGGSSAGNAVTAIRFFTAADTTTTTGTQRMGITSSGNVGIGTADPDAPLSFADSMGTKINFYDDYNYDIGIQSYLMEFITEDSDGDFAFGYGSSGSLTRVMTIEGAGNVGIGTTAPDWDLEVSGPSTTGISIEDTGTTASLQKAVWYHDAGYLDLQIRSDANALTSTPVKISQSAPDNSLVILATSGNVGIGTTTPATQLEILSTTTQLRLTHTDGVDEADFLVNADGELSITPTSLAMYLNNGTAGDAIFGFHGATTIYTLTHDDSEGDLQLSANDTTNFAKFEADGTLEFNGTATVWRDINMGSAQLSRPTSSQPDLVTFVDEAGADTGIQTYGFAVGEKVHGSFEIQHDYKEGSDFTFHVHWQGITAPSGTDNVQWRLTYTLMRDGATLDATTTIDSPDTPFDTQYEGVRSDFTAITGTNYLIGDQFLFTLERVAPTGDVYAGDAIIATAGIHYEVDTVGSRLITTK